MADVNSKTKLPIKSHSNSISNSSMASSKMSLKLLVDKKGQRVLFAEASKEFVDFLFRIFSLPLGTLIELLGSKQMVGCLGKLNDSVASFNQTYFQPGIYKDSILNHKSPFNGNALLLSYDDAPSDAPVEIYRCFNPIKVNDVGYIYGYRTTCQQYATLFKNAKCPGCNGIMNDKMKVVLSKKKEVKTVRKKRKLSEGYVKEVATYMVMDDLVVKPMSTISSITVINSFGVKDLSQLEEKTVSFGNDEALKLLKASLTTNNVLTTLFVPA